MKQRFRFLLSLFFAAPLSLSLSLSLCTFSACFWCWCRCKYFRRRTRWLITAQSSSSIWKISRDGGLLVCFCFKRLWNGAILLWSSTLFVSHTHTHTHTHIYTQLHLHTFSLILFVINGWNRRSYLWCLSSLVFDNRRGDGQDERLRLLRAAYGKLEDAGWFPNRSVKWRRQLLFEWSGSMRAQARSFLLTAAQVLVKSAAETWRADILIGYNWNVGEERVNWDQIGGQWSNRTP